ncbi:TolB family protein, partial [Lysobacter sp. 2RAB21]
RTLRRHEPSTGKFEVLSANIPWDVDQLALAEDGKHLLFVSNEDGVGKLHVLSLPQHKEIKLPALPVGVIGRADFSPDGKRIALAINTATSPSDLYVIDLASAKLARWTRSEVGGLDSTRFVTPSLIRYPTFDTVDGGVRRTIPAFYY